MAKNENVGLSRRLAALVFLCAMALVTSGLAVESEAAKKPKPPKEPLCGPSILYECTFRDGTTELVGLTLCEVGKYEKKNKATCEPYAG